MDEATKGLFAEMFGGQNRETPEVSKTETSPAPVAERDDDADGMHERPDLEAERIETEEKCETKADDGCDPKLLESAKKELGTGGAAFCDELFATCPEVFQRLRDAKKTLSGFFNFAYSYALDEYVRKNGRKNGGGYWDISALAEKYLDPSVKEGFTVKEPEAKRQTPPAPKAADAVKAVKKVAKKAAKAAKADAKAAKADANGNPPAEPSAASVEEEKDIFANLDFSAFG